MSLNKPAYVLSKKYTDDTVIGLGALKGSPCRIKSVVKKDGQNIITFEWVSTVDPEVKETTEVIVDDGTCIYTYTPGDTYHYGDLAIYQGMFYQCTHEHVAPEELNPSWWNPIGAPDGAYGLVENIEDLPSRYSSQDRKIYYVMSTHEFWLWNGTRWALEIGTINNDEIDELFI